MRGLSSVSNRAGSARRNSTSCRACASLRRYTLPPTPGPSAATKSSVASGRWRAWPGGSKNRGAPNRPQQPQPPRRSDTRNRADEAVHPASGLLPDLDGRRLRLEFAAREVLELVRPERAVLLARVEFFGEPRRGVHEVRRVLVRHGRDQPELGAVGPQRVDLFGALVTGHDDHGAATERAADHREAGCRRRRGLLSATVPDCRARPCVAL